MKTATITRKNTMPTPTEREQIAPTPVARPCTEAEARQAVNRSAQDYQTARSQHATVWRHAADLAARITTTDEAITRIEQAHRRDEALTALGLTPSSEDAELHQLRTERAALQRRHDEATDVLAERTTAMDEAQCAGQAAQRDVDRLVRETAAARRHEADQRVEAARRELRAAVDARGVSGFAGFLRGTKSYDSDSALLTLVSEADAEWLDSEEGVQAVVKRLSSRAPCAGGTISMLWGTYQRSLRS